MALGSLGTLSVDIQANIRRFNQNMNQVQSSLSSTAQKFKQIGANLTKFVTVPLIGLGALSVKTGAEFEAGMSKVQAISGATVKEMEQLENKAKEIGRTTKFSAIEATEAMRFMALAGWDTNQIMGSLEATMNLAVASGEDLALVTDIVTDSMTAFGLTTKDTVNFTDLLASTSSSANTNIAMLGESFRYVAPIAGGLGVSSQDTALALGLMANAGIKASNSGTALRSVLTRLAAPNKKVSETLNELGVETIKTSNGSLDLKATIERLRESFKNLTPDQKASSAESIAGKFAMSGLLAVVNATEKDFDKLATSIDNSSGKAKNMSKIMGDNLVGNLTILKSTFEGLLIVISQRLNPIVEVLVNITTKAIEIFNNMSPTLQTIIIVIGGIVAILGPLLTAIGFLIPAFTALAGVIGGISTPVLIVVGVITGLIAIITTLWKTNENFRNAVTRIWEAIKITAIQIWQRTVKPMFKQVFEAIKETVIFIMTTIKKFWDMWGNEILILAETIWNQIKLLIEVVINLIRDIILSVLALIRGDWDAFGSAINGIVDSIVTYIKDSFENFAPIFKGIWDGFKNIIENVWNDIKSIISSIVDWIIGKIDSIMSKIRALQKGASTIIGGIKSVGTSIVGGVKSVTSKVPFFEKGTNYVPNDGLAYLHKGEAVIPASQNKGRTGNGITINVTGNTISNGREADKLATTIVSKLRMAGVNP